MAYYCASLLDLGCESMVVMRVQLENKYLDPARCGSGQSGTWHQSCSEIHKQICRLPDHTATSAYSGKAAKISVFPEPLRYVRMSGANVAKNNVRCCNEAEWLLPVGNPVGLRPWPPDCYEKGKYQRQSCLTTSLGIKNPESFCLVSSPDVSLDVLI